jgi:hypothetical protein
MQHLPVRHECLHRRCCFDRWVSLKKEKRKNRKTEN